MLTRQALNIESMGSIRYLLLFYLLVIRVITSDLVRLDDAALWYDENIFRSLLPRGQDVHLLLLLLLILQFLKFKALLPQELRLVKFLLLN